MNVIIVNCTDDSFYTGRGYSTEYPDAYPFRTLNVVIHQLGLLRRRGFDVVAIRDYGVAAEEVLAL